MIYQYGVQATWIMDLVREMQDSFSKGKIESVSSLLRVYNITVYRHCWPQKGWGGIVLLSAAHEGWFESKGDWLGGCRSLQDRPG